jgi:hypothetical protein
LIPLTRRTVETIRSVFRAALGLSPQQPGPPLLVQSGSDGLCVSAATATRGIRYRLDGSFPEQEFRLPFEFLKEAEGPRNDAVLLDPTIEDIRVQWVVDSDARQGSPTSLPRTDQNKGANCRSVRSRRHSAPFPSNHQSRRAHLAGHPGWSLLQPHELPHLSVPIRVQRLDR